MDYNNCTHGLVHDSGNSITNTLELAKSGAKPWIFS